MGYIISPQSLNMSGISCYPHLFITRAHKLIFYRVIFFEILHENDSTFEASGPPISKVVDNN